MKISNSLLWVKPYLESCEDLVNLKKLTRIRSFRTPTANEDSSWGVLTKQDDGSYSMTIRTHAFVTRNNRPAYVPLVKGILIDTLAHEIAHIKHWEHDEEHFDLQTKILRRFSKVVTKKKVKLWTNR